jgi:hypothetical protein
MERIVVNWALPSDFVYHTVRSRLNRDRATSDLARLSGIWHGKIRKYQKLLAMKQRHGGAVPERLKRICRRSPCGYTRLLMSYLH